MNNCLRSSILATLLACSANTHTSGCSNNVSDICSFPITIQDNYGKNVRVDGDFRSSLRGFIKGKGVVSANVIIWEYINGGIFFKIDLNYPGDIKKKNYGYSETFQMYYKVQRGLIEIGNTDMYSAREFLKTQILEEKIPTE